MSGNNVIINSTGQVVECTACPCQDVCSTSCDEGICCVEGPNQISITVETTAFGSSACSTGNCDELDGLHIATYHAEFPTTCIWSESTDFNCGTTFNCRGILSSTEDSMLYDWEIRMVTPGKVRVDLRQAIVKFTTPVLGCEAQTRHRFIGNLPLSFNSLFDCSLSTPITCVLSSIIDVAANGLGCYATSTNITLTVEAV